MKENWKEIKEDVTESVADLNRKMRDLGIEGQITEEEMISLMPNLGRVLEIMIPFWGCESMTMTSKIFPQVIEATANYYFVVYAILKGASNDNHR